MRLINFGPGEIADRLTILALKITYGAQAGKPVDHFEKERNALLTQIRSRELNGSWFEHVLELGAVNAQIWQDTDAVRAWRFPRSAFSPADLDSIRVLAFRLQVMNDRRAELIALINTATGNHEGSEKV